ncbi:MAG: hypothetical protein GY698_24060 [Actinomycetia bacterium]|nr:hypothetical protein [Actinomycetes bacterium]
MEFPVSKFLMKVLVAMSLVVSSAALSADVAAAQTYTISHWSWSWASPNMYYTRSSPFNSTLNTYMTISATGQRIRASRRGGSGNGSTNECESFAGWLPGGTYGRGDGDSKSNVVLKNKQSGGTVVRGWVWELFAKDCNGGSGIERNDLFIHSQGNNGGSWNSGNYSSWGCVKIDQDDRTYLADSMRYQVYRYWDERLTVY